MKEFRKDEKGFFICEECGKKFKNKQGLIYHNVYKHSIDSKSYFDKWIKDEEDDKCQICGGKTELASSGRGYKKTCSSKCQILYIRILFKDKYGVENLAQNINLYEKAQKKSFRMLPFRNTNMWYQGTFERDFLERYYEKYPDIERGPSIKYFFKGKPRYYFPDFYIPSINLIVECKNSYLAKRDKEMIEAKKKEILSRGFEFILIINKDYSGVSI